jgi:UDP-4-amino-4-deoxy-L-arabinose-oxoglutarate aminotransferase
MKVPFYRHSLGAGDAASIAQVLETPFLTSGAVGKKVEQDLSRFFGVPHALLVNSWTNGAEATLLAMGIGPGHEVIVPAMTFISSANIAEILGAKPVFADVDPDTLLLRPEAVRQALTPATRAVIPVHLYGQMCDVQALRAVLADRPDVAIIEDCAHCFEGSLNGALPGAYSDAAIFSFYATKNVTCGEGGAIITRNPDLYAKLVQTRLHGMSAGAVDRYRQGAYAHWDMRMLGTKANLPDLLAALLPGQIANIRQRLPRREALARRYEQHFRGTPIRLVKPVPGAISARHIFPIHVPPTVRDRAIAVLNEQEIGVTVNFRSVPTMTYYREKYGYGPGDFPVSYAWGEGEITLPLFPSMSEAEQDHVVHSVLKHVVPLVAQAGG